MSRNILVALDQGTTSSRAIVFDEAGRILAAHAIEFKQHYPQPGWVEHDPEDILNTQITALQKAVEMSGVEVQDIAAIGITNQRETTLLWEKDTGRCVHNAIVWQCRRTAPYVERLVKEGKADLIRRKTGLVPDAYFSGTKLAYLLDTLNLHERAERGELCFGTVDSFLCWNLVEGRPHVTDATNAGRTMLFNIHTQTWDDELLSMLNIPRAVLPEVVDSAHVVGNLRPEILGRPIPVAAMAGDQHAALFGQGCFTPGMVKNTYGTGCFMLMNTGDTPIESRNGLLTTMAWRLNGKPTYALEGSVFMGGATVQWLRDEMKLITTAAESEQIAQSISDTAGVFLVPAFTGLGRALLGYVQPGHHRGHDPWHGPGPHRPRGAGGHLLPEPRSLQRHGGRPGRRKARPDERRRRRQRQRLHDAVPVGYSGHPRGAACGAGDHGAGRGPVGGHRRGPVRQQGGSRLHGRARPDLPAPDGQPQPRSGPVRLAPGRGAGPKLGGNTIKQIKTALPEFPSAALFFYFPITSPV